VLPAATSRRLGIDLDMASVLQLRKLLIGPG